MLKILSQSVLAGVCAAGLLYTYRNRNELMSMFGRMRSGGQETSEQTNNSTATAPESDVMTETSSTPLIDIDSKILCQSWQEFVTERQRNETASSSQSQSKFAEFEIVDPAIRLAAQYPRLVIRTQRYDSSDHNNYKLLELGRGICDALASHLECNGIGTAAIMYSTCRPR